MTAVKKKNIYIINRQKKKKIKQKIAKKNMKEQS